LNPFLDDWLEGQSPRQLTSKRRALKFLHRAYTACVSDLLNKPRTDLTSENNVFSFHHGTPLPDLRLITSWMLTHAPNKRALARLIPALWKRHGREDLTVAGMLLANLENKALGQDGWMAFIHLLQRQEPLMVVLEVAEELVRGGRPVPNDDWMEAAASQSPNWHQYCVLFLSLRKNGVSSKRLVSQAPKGGEMFERIRARLLATED
jgi:hypothetical protein